MGQVIVSLLCYSNWINCDNLYLPGDQFVFLLKHVGQKKQRKESPEFANSQQSMRQAGAELCQAQLGLSLLPTS